MSMSAIRVHQFGGPEVLQYVRNVAMLKPGTRQVVVKVMAAGVNPVDTYIRAGTYARKPTLPYTPGSDGSGIVQEVGQNVTSLKVGDRVWFCGSLSGSYAEYSLCKDTNVYPLNEKVSFEQGAALGGPYFTAYRSLHHKGHVKAGETVLIHGASGGVGVAAVNIALAYGLQVFGTAGSAEGLDMLKGIGVKHVFNHRSENYENDIMAATSGEGVNIILEMLANVNLGKDLKLLATNGRIMVIGNRGTVEINPRDAMSREASIHGVMLRNATEEEIKQSADFITKGLETGQLQPVIGRKYKLEDASVAHKDIIEGTCTKGKMVLIVD